MWSVVGQRAAAEDASGREARVIKDAKALRHEATFPFSFTLSDSNVKIKNRAHQGQNLEMRSFLLKAEVEKRFPENCVSF